jgi:hypothetical protein
MLFSCLGVSSLSLLPQRSLLRMAIACTSSAGESSLQLTPFWRQRLAELRSARQQHSRRLQLALGDSRRVGSGGGKNTPTIW